MGDRVQSDKLQPSDAMAPPPPSQAPTTCPPAPTSAKPAPPPGTYIIQVPKDQIYRVPPPENARRYQHLSKRKPRGSCCRRCCCCFLAFILFLVVAAGIAAAVMYLVFRPESPDYTINSVSIKGFNLSSSPSSLLSPEFNVAVSAKNPNDKIGIYYEKGSSVKIDYKDVTLCEGVLPVFYQPPNNVTVFAVALKGSGIELTDVAKKALLEGERKGTVPLKLRLTAPVRIEVGDAKTWKLDVKVKCEITVDKLTAASMIVSKDCGYGVELW